MRTKDASRWGFILLFLIFCAAGLQGKAWAVERPSQAILEADNVVFEEATGQAVASGDVCLTHEGVRLYAPYLEYDSNAQRAKAHSSPGQPVILLMADKRLEGDELDYDIATGEGLLTNAHGKGDAVYFKGKDVQVAPLSDAVRLGWLSSRFAEMHGETSGDVVLKWSGVSATTCDRPRPHYRLESRSVTIIPKDRIILKNPKIYIGNKLLFSYPFDYVIMLNEKASNSLVPIIAYDSNKGVGVGVRGPFEWDFANAYIGATAWTRTGMEFLSRLDREVTPGVDVFVEDDYSYNEDLDESTWRPQWGTNLSFSGWQAKIFWSEREALGVERQAGITYWTTLWRSPEILLSSPWWKILPKGGGLRLIGRWGDYDETKMGVTYSSKRYGGGFEISGDLGGRENGMRPYYRLLYLHYDYDKNDAWQALTTAKFGFLWKWSSLDLDTSYVRRWIQGQSPMQWDQYDPLEELYQQVGFTFLKPSPDEAWKFSVRAGYDFREDNIFEMLYVLEYDQHCIDWKLIYRDDLRESDDWIILTLTIKAYPNVPLSVGGTEETDDTFNQ